MFQFHWAFQSFTLFVNILLDFINYRVHFPLEKSQLALRQRDDEGLTLETPAFSLFTVANLHFQPSC